MKHPFAEAACMAVAPKGAFSTIRDELTAIHEDAQAAIMTSCGIFGRLGLPTGPEEGEPEFSSHGEIEETFAMLRGLRAELSTLRRLVNTLDSRL